MFIVNINDIILLDLDRYYLDLIYEPKEATKNFAVAIRFRLSLMESNTITLCY